jgi:type IV secretion system protein VirB1
VIPFECIVGVEYDLMTKVIHVESSANPFAIGVVGGRLVRQPKNLQDAVATVLSLEKSGINYSVGIAQVNRVHFQRLGWKDDIRQGFDVCKNLKAGSGVLETCYTGAIKAGYLAKSNHYSAVDASLSCYYSGDFVRGAQLGYVKKVLGTDAAAVFGGITMKRKSAASLMID